LGHSLSDPPFCRKNARQPNVDQRKSCSPISHADVQEISAKNIAGWLRYSSKTTDRAICAHALFVKNCQKVHARPEALFRIGFDLGWARGPKPKKRPRRFHGNPGRGRKSALINISTPVLKEKISFLTNSNCQCRTREPDNNIGVSLDLMALCMA
jgi:hypothetical protein